MACIPVIGIGAGMQMKLMSGFATDGNKYVSTAAGVHTSLPCGSSHRGPCALIKLTSCHVLPV